MGHDLAPGVVDRLLPLLIPHFQAAGASSNQHTSDHEYA
jgi:hypothetical protein